MMVLREVKESGRFFNFFVRPPAPFQRCVTRMRAFACHADACIRTTSTCVHSHDTHRWNLVRLRQIQAWHLRLSVIGTQSAAKNLYGLGRCSLNQRNPKFI
jgi:hypothetical protein